MNKAIDPIGFFVSQKLHQFSSDCSSRVSELHRADSLRQVRFLLDVRSDPTVRWAVNNEPAYRRLTTKARQHAEKILDAQLATISSLGSADERRNAINQMRSREWCFLRGNWPELAYKAEREAARLSR